MLRIVIKRFFHKSERHTILIMKLKNMLLAIPFALAQAAHSTELSMTVYKTPTCGCCQKWIDHLHENEMEPNVVSMDDLSPIKTKFNIAGRYRSCHTAVVTTEEGGYVFEGHVPAEYVAAFLSNPPEGSIGLSVPGMPIGSPGMEVGDRKEYYQVLLLLEDGSNAVYAEVN